MKRLKKDFFRGYNPAGFTMVELTISIVISGILTLAAGMMLLTSNREALRLPEITRVRQEFTIANKYLSTTVMTARRGSLEITDTYGGSAADSGSAMSVTDGANDVRTIYKSGDMLIMEINGGTPDTILAAGVSDLKFVPISNRGVRMTLELIGANTQIGGSSEAHFRN